MIWEPLLHDLEQDINIGQATRQADRAQSSASAAESQITALSRRVERLTLACQALWELLRQTQGLTDKQLQSKMLEIDLRDGKADGKIGQQPTDCKTCGAKNNTRRSHCIMCGAVLHKPHLFE